VLADPSITPSDLPRWIRREEVFNIDPTTDRDEERWKALVLELRGGGKTNRVPYMPGDLSADFVPRPVEYAALKTAVLTEAPNRAVAVIGAGGYGKTMLVNALCRDPDMRFEFSDGIVRVEIGKERTDVTGLVSDLIEKLDPKGKRPAFVDVVTASEHLGELIGESRLLLVIDDVWREAQLRPFLRGGPNCVRLVTTRLPHVFPRDIPHTEVRIDEMRAAEAVSLISMNLPMAGEPGGRARFSALAERRGNWAQMLSVANGWVRDRVKKGERVADSIARFEQRLAKDGPFVFNAKDETQRNRAIRLCIDASVEDLDASEASRFGDLAVLPEDERVPLGTVEVLWAETGQLDKGDTDDLLGRLDDLSLLQRLDLGGRTLRLHDNILWYLRDRVGADRCRAVHNRMVAALGKQCDCHWDMLPSDNQYGWRFLIKHLRGAGRETDADRLLADYSWIKAKLRASGARDLYNSYLPESQNEGARLIGRAIALSLPALTASPRELPRQLFGRLGGIAHQATSAIVTSAQQDVDFRPAPRWPGLTPPGAERLRLVGHQGPVLSAAFSPDGARIVTASLDGTARLWDATSGQKIIALRGHEYGVSSASFSPDGARIVTASEDRAARLWDATTGQEIIALRGHEGPLESASFSPDGARIVTASDDRTARLWDATTGQEIIALRGHEGGVWSASFSPEIGRAACGERV
jgi:hypothetical protein